MLILQDCSEVLFRSCIKSSWSFIFFFSMSLKWHLKIPGYSSVVNNVGQIMCLLIVIILISLFSLLQIWKTIF